ncbi:MAG: tetratricopeptide repeat protein [Acidobacteriota bacterium]
MSFIAAAILGTILLAPPQAADRRAEAERLAQSGSYAQALKEFQTLAAANPDDIPARLWIARLHALMGHPERAAEVFQSITATEPRNVDALIGLGDALTTSGQFDRAGEALKRAEAVAADRPAMLAAQGRLHRLSGHPTLALAYYQRALALDAGNLQARRAFDELTADRAHRLEASYDFEHFNTLDPDTHSGTVSVNLRAGEAVRLFGGGQHLRKFDLDENRGGGGIEWFARRDVHLRAGALFGGDTILPQSDTSVDLDFSRGRLALLGGFRYLHFDTSATWLWTPGVTVTLNDRAAVTVRYYHSNSTFDNLLLDQLNDGYSFGFTGQLGRRAWLDLGFERGFEGLPLITVERLSQLDSNNFSAGVRFEVTPRTSIGGAYGYQRREADTRVSTMAINLVQRF